MAADTELLEKMNDFAEVVTDHVTSTSYVHELGAHHISGGERTPNVTTSGGDAVSASTDCSGWVSFALNSVAPMSFAVADQYREQEYEGSGTASNWSRAWIYERLFEGDVSAVPTQPSESAYATGSFEGFTDMNGLREGDIFAWASNGYADDNFVTAWLAKNKKVDNLTGDSGHIMIVRSKTEMDTASDDYQTIHDALPASLKGSVKILEVVVTDSSSVEHYKELGPRVDHNGLGTGTIFLAVDTETGEAKRFLFNVGGNWHPQTSKGETQSFAAAHLTSDIVIGDEDLRVDKFGNAIDTLGGMSFGVFDGTISGEAGLVKTGSGFLKLNGTYTYKGTTTVSQGRMEIAGELAGGGAVEVKSGATLAPGVGAGSLTVNSGFKVASGGILLVDIAGSAAGSSHDEIRANGSVDIDGATLSLEVTDGGTVGESHTIVDKSGHEAVTGSFSGLAEGDTIAGGGRTFQISYSGGTGNDIVLTDVSATGDNSIVSGLVVTDLSQLVNVTTLETVAELTVEPSRSDFESGHLSIGLPSGASVTDLTVRVPANVDLGSEGLTFRLPTTGSVSRAIVDVPSELSTTAPVQLYMNSATTDLVLTGSGATATHANGRANTISGNEAADTISAFASADTVSGGTGSDVIYGNYGQDVIYGNADADRLFGGKEGDQLYGGAAEDTIYGNTDGDTLEGGGGDDTLYGGQGDDVILGGAGDDALYGGLGNDTLTGGAGSDSFVFNDGGGTDTIADFSAGDGDTIAIATDINGTGIASFTDLSGRLTDSGGNLVIDVGNGQTITVSGLTSATAAESSFSFF